MENIQQSVLDQLKTIPHEPGIYKYYDANKKLLYIGKAKNLRKRVGSYFTNKKNLASRTRLMVRKIREIKYVIVDNEKDAFLLENELIKSERPKYNIQLRDDKTYPYITITNESFPRVFFTRIVLKNGSEYYGPYTGVKHVRGIMRLVKKLYPTRNCNLNLSKKNIEQNKFSVCLEYHIGNCLGPCVGHQGKDAYDESIHEIRQILKGNVREVKHIFKEKMLDAAEELKFEEAQTHKEKITYLDRYISKSTIVNPNLGDLHVWGIAEDDKNAFANYLCIANGSIIKTKNLKVKKGLEETLSDILAHLIIGEIGNVEQVVEILVQTEVDFENFSQYKISVPKIGDKRKLVQLAQKNALQAKKEALLKKHSGMSKKEQLLSIMRSDLKMNELPFHIECFDNSNIQGSDPVAACVVFKNGKPANKEYRHYNIKTVEGPDDFASMKEVVYRRYRRLLEERSPLPQLVLIDGGKGQLSNAFEAATELGITDKVQFIAIAKRLEEIYYPNDSIPLLIGKKSPTLKVLQQLRNEAHRFAISFHRSKRIKGNLGSELTNIDGIGEKSTQLLLKKFKSVKRIKKSSVEELAKVVGKNRARILMEYFDSISEQRRSDPETSSG